MKSRSTLNLSISLLGLMGFLSLAQASVNSETKNAALKLGAGTVGEVSFSKESADLSESAKNDLRDIISEASKKGEIKNARVAVWADQEYPPKGVEISQSQVDLAKKRAESVQAFLEKSLSVSDVSVINMAERPTRVQEMFNTSGTKTKKALEKSGAAPTDKSHEGLFGLKGKASYAVVMVYFK